MTPKQQKFCDEYLISGNATEAAIKAGYSRKTAKQTGSENLSKPDLRAYITEQLEKIHSVKIADAQEVLEHLTTVMRGEMTEKVPLFCGDGCQRLVNKNTAVKDRLRAAELLGKRYRLFDDNGSSQAANAIADFLKALHPMPGDIAALYAQEQDDGKQK